MYVPDPFDLRYRPYFDAIEYRREVCLLAVWGRGVLSGVRQFRRHAPGRSPAGTERGGKLLETQNGKQAGVVVGPDSERG
jgi:hypothetical protein